MDLFALIGGDGDSDDEYFRQRILNKKNKKPKHGGSAPGRGANKDRGREDAGKRLFSDYLSPNSTYNDKDFRCRFRMRRELFETIVNALEFDDESDYFTQRPDATGLLGFLPEQKVTCALRILAYGSSADQLDELIRMGESVTR